MHVIHMLICLIYSIFLESRIFVSGMSKVWEETNGYAKQYMCAFAIYIITVLSSSSGIILCRVFDAPGHGKNVVDEINATDKHHLK